MVRSDDEQFDWQSLIPEVTLRPIQPIILDRVWGALFEQDRSVALLEAPTGIGKSVVELAICRRVQMTGGNGFIVTPQRTLQDQLGQWNGVKVMKGRGSYGCNLVDGCTAANAPCVKDSRIRECSESDHGVDDDHECSDSCQNKTCSDFNCPYFSALREAKGAPVVAHNYASLMAQSHMGGHFGTRAVMCLDEGHTAAQWVRNYLTIELSESDVIAITSMPVPDDDKDFMRWFRLALAVMDDSKAAKMPDDLVGRLLKIFSHPGVYGLRKIESLEEEFRRESADQSDKTDSNLRTRSKFMTWALENLSDSVVPWHVERSKGNDDETVWKATPVRVAPVSNILTGLGIKIVVVSATILHPTLMLSELGMRSADSETIKIDSAFDPSRRPIVRRYAGRMSSRHQSSTFPRAVEELIRIAEKHRDEPGIIHTVSHNLSWNVFSALTKRLPGRRLLRVPRSSDRDEVISSFLSGKYGPSAILIGPSLLEGIDGKGDSCRWQAMIKVPWIHRMDPVASHLLDNSDSNIRRWGSAWYTWKACQASVQGFGRVCRSPDDYGITYLIDAGFEDIIGSRLIPSYVSDAIRRQ